MSTAEEDFGGTSVKLPVTRKDCGNKCHFLDKSSEPQLKIEPTVHPTENRKTSTLQSKSELG